MRLRFGLSRSLVLESLPRGKSWKRAVDARKMSALARIRKNHRRSIRSIARVLRNPAGVWYVSPNSTSPNRNLPDGRLASPRPLGDRPRLDFRLSILLSDDARSTSNRRSLGTQRGRLSLPQTFPRRRFPANKDADRNPTTLLRNRRSSRTIAGGLSGDVVEVPTGQLLELKTGAAESVLVRWNYSSFIRYKTTRDQGALRRGLVHGRGRRSVILVGAVWNGDGYAAGPMRWVVVSGKALQPPSGRRSERSPVVTLDDSLDAD